MTFDEALIEEIAPGLLASHRELLAALTGMLARYDYHDQLPDDHPIIAGRAAIARAEGRQP